MMNKQIIFNDWEHDEILWSYDQNKAKVIDCETIRFYIEDRIFDVCYTTSYEARYLISLIRDVYELGKLRKAKEIRNLLDK